MKQETVPVTIRVQDKEMLIACPVNEQEDLLASAKYLDGKMKEIRTTGKIVGADRVALLAAINITHELLQLKKKDRSEGETIDRLKALQNKLESATHNLKQMEF